MVELLFTIMGKQTEIIKYYDVSDPTVQNLLKGLADDFKHVLDYGELPSDKSSETWGER